MKSAIELERLQRRVVKCQKCFRLVSYLQEIEEHKPKRFRDWVYWSKPLPSFGDPYGRVLVVGLAPAAHEGNRTGRMFTGDCSGEWLFNALYQFGFANQPNSLRADDGLRLEDCYITATLRCAPPKNKPSPEEIKNCQPYFLEELGLLRNVKILIPLGQIAFNQTLRALRLKGVEVPPLSFGHERIYPLPNGMTIITSYHPSQQNTQTGRLTKPMFHRVFEIVTKRLKSIN